MNKKDIEIFFSDKEIIVPAKTVLLREGQKAKALYIVKKGCVRFWFNHNGKDITNQFFFEGNGVASMESMLKNEPSSFTIETIEPCVLGVMERKDFVELLKNNPEFKEWFNAFILKRFFYYSKHFLSYLKNNPEQRYKELLKSHPDIIKRVPQHYIASYLGITSVSLSRIRGRK